MDSSDVVPSRSGGATDWKRKMNLILARLKRHPSSIYFLEPVDPVKLNVPLYPCLIQHPIDISSIQDKLESSAYKDAESMARDIVSMFQNALLFNGPPSAASPVYTAAKSMYESFCSLYVSKFNVDPPCPRPSLCCENPDRRPDALEVIKLTPTNRQVFAEILSKMTSKFESHIMYYLYPVDPILYPDYYKKISHPMSITIVETKLELGLYETAEEFANDVRQVWNNAQLYNVNNKFARVASKLADKFEKYYEKGRGDLKQGSRIVIPTRPKKRSRKGSVGEADDSSSIINIVGPASTSAPSPSPISAPSTAAAAAAEAVAVAVAPAKPSPAPSATNVATIPKKPKISHFWSKQSLESCVALDSFKSLREAAATAGKDAPGAAELSALFRCFDSYIVNAGNVSTKPDTEKMAKELNFIFHKAAKAVGAGTQSRLLERLATEVGKLLSIEIHTNNAIASGGFHEAQCLAIVNKLLKDERSTLFRDPVDRSLTNYYDVIKHPIDLRTLKSRVTSKQYTSDEQFAEDARLIWKNCRQFNMESVITDLSDALSKKFEQLFAARLATKPSSRSKKSKGQTAASASENAMSKDPNAPMTPVSQKKCLMLLRRLMRSDMAADFCIPLDPVLFNYSGYDDVIKRRMDLSTVRKELEANNLKTPQQFWEDTGLCFRNALIYSGTPEPTKVSAMFLQNQFNLDFQEAFPGLSAGPKPWTPVARKALAAITQYDYGNLFGEPVNPIKFSLFNYFEKVPKPMDLDTIRRKLNAGLYATRDEFMSDVDRTWSNCIDYHGDLNKELTNVARQCRERFASDWQKFSKQAEKQQKPPTATAITTVATPAAAAAAASTTAPPTAVTAAGTPKPAKEKTPKKSPAMGCLQIVRRLKKMDTEKAFCSPVDLVAYPTYTKFVSEPVDLGTIENRVVNGEISTAEEFVRLLQLLFENCRSYNFEGTPVRLLGEKLNAWLNPVLELSRKEGKLLSSLQEQLAKADQRRQVKLQKEKERLEKRNSKALEKAQKLAEKDKIREAKQKEKELKQKQKEQKALQKDKISGAKRPRPSTSAEQTNTAPTPTPGGGGGVDVSVVPPPAKLPRLEKSKLLPKTRPPLPSLPVVDDNSLVRTHPPRPPLLRCQRDQLLHYCRQRASHLLGLQTAVTSSTSKKGSAQLKQAQRSARASLVGRTSADKQKGVASPSASATLAGAEVRLRWKSRRRRPRRSSAAASTVASASSAMQIDSSDAARDWETRTRDWIRRRRQEQEGDSVSTGNGAPGATSNAEGNAGDTAEGNNNFLHGNRQLAFAVPLRASVLRESSMRLGFKRHPIAPLWLRCSRHTFQLELRSPTHFLNDDVEEPFSVDVLHLVMLGAAEHLASLRVRIAPISGARWEKLLAVEDSISLVQQHKSSDEERSFLCEPDLKSQPDLLSLAKHLRSFKWHGEGCYISESAVGTFDPALSIYIIGLQDTLSLQIDGVDWTAFVHGAGEQCLKPPQEALSASDSATSHESVRAFP